MLIMVEWILVLAAHSPRALGSFNGEEEVSRKPRTWPVKARVPRCHFFGPVRGESR